MVVSDHPHVKAIERELQWTGTKWNHILVIRTDLELDVTAPDHDGQLVHEMMSVVCEAMQKANKGFDSLVLRRV
jgi:hypothetical protein